MFVKGTIDLSIVRATRIWSLFLLLNLNGCPKSGPLKLPASITADVHAVPAVPSGDAAGVSADSASPLPRHPLNVLYISIDSLRADILHPRGTNLPVAFGENPATIAPALVALAHRSVTYSRAYALSSYTSMSVGGMYGGKLPGELSRNGYFFGHYRDNVLMLAERLTQSGVRTMAAHAHFYFTPGGAGLDQGFAEWRLLPGLVRNNSTDVEVTSNRLAPLVQEMLQRASQQDRPWFLHTHFMDPHDEYRRHVGSPPLSVARGARASFLGEVWFTDQHLGRLLEWVSQQPWAQRTAIIISADHGEMFGEHHHFRHGFYLWEELIRVPWIFAIPGLQPRVIDVPRSHLDLAPTIMDLLGVPPADDLRGHSLRAELEGAVAQERPVWVDLPQTSDNDRWRARIDGYIKTVSHGDNDASFNVYNLLEDPEELHPLSRDNPTRIQAVEAFRRERTQWHDVAPDTWHPRP